ncbi:MAG TPA: helix-turn-helix domain-containing protein [Actinomycetota bacterium]|nr:helix-turn-helix domain-containing protein [Actinomycetota bacterium]
MSGQASLLTVREVARLLAVSPRYVQLLAQRGELPHVRIGRLVRVRAEDLAAFVQARSPGFAGPRAGREEAGDG